MTDSSPRWTPRGKPGTFAYRYDESRLRTATDWPVAILQVARWVLTDQAAADYDDGFEALVVPAEDLVEMIDAHDAREAFQGRYGCSPEAHHSWTLSGTALCRLVASELEPVVEAPVVPISWKDLKDREAAHQEWDVERVFLMEHGPGGAREYAEARAHRWPDGWRIYTIPARGELRDLIKAREATDMKPGPAARPITADLESRGNSLVITSTVDTAELERGDLTLEITVDLARWQRLHDRLEVPGMLEKPRPRISIILCAADPVAVKTEPAADLPMMPKQGERCINCEELYTGCRECGHWDCRCNDYEGPCVACGLSQCENCGAVR